MVINIIFAGIFSVLILVGCSDSKNNISAVKQEVAEEYVDQDFIYIACRNHEPTGYEQLELYNDLFLLYLIFDKKQKTYQASRIYDYYKKTKVHEIKTIDKGSYTFDLENYRLDRYKRLDRKTLELTIIPTELSPGEEVSRFQCKNFKNRDIFEGFIQETIMEADKRAVRKIEERKMDNKI